MEIDENGELVCMLHVMEFASHLILFILLIFNVDRDEY